MVMMTLWGALSPQVTQILTDAICIDLQNAAAGCLDSEALENLRKIGSSGQHPNRCWSDFLHTLPAPKLCKPFRFIIPLKNKLLGLFHRPTHMCQGLPDIQCNITAIDYYFLVYRFGMGGSWNFLIGCNII